jgi:hypothetical protein
MDVKRNQESIMIESGIQNMEFGGGKEVLNSKFHILN